MSLIEKLSEEFEKGVRDRGRLYYISKAVRLTQGNIRAVQATAQGSTKYHIKLSRDKDTLSVSCTCPYYESTGPCKHIWAALLAATDKGYLSGPGDNATSKRVRLVMDDEDDVSAQRDDEDYDDDDDETDEETDEYQVLSEGRKSLAKPQSQKQPQVQSQVQAKSRPAATSVSPPPGGSAPGSSAPDRSVKSDPPQPAVWKKHLASVKQAMQSESNHDSNSWSSGREIFYIVDVPTSTALSELVVEVAFRERKANGEWSQLKSQRIPSSQVARLPNAADQQIIALLIGAKEQTEWSGYYYDSAPCRYRIAESSRYMLLPLMCRTGRCRLRLSPHDTEPEMPFISWDDQGPWEFWLQVSPDELGNHYLVTGSLRRDHERLELTEPVMMLAGGVVFTHNQAAQLDDSKAFKWVALLREHGTLSVPINEQHELLQEILRLPQVPPLELPEELQYEEVSLVPRPRLKLRPPAARRNHWSAPSDRLRGELSFDYDGNVVAADNHHPYTRGVYQSDKRRLLLRDEAAEQAAAEQLRQLGFRRSSYTYNTKPELELPPSKLPRVVRTLVAADWHVEAEGKLYRQSGEVRVEVKSGIDWFELHGTVEFGDTAAVATLPALLAALKRGENAVRLDDGTFGMIPEEWLKKYGTLAGLGTAEDDHLRFTRTQVGVLDALLAAQPEATFDVGFRHARDQLQRFERIEPREPPSGFTGQLRPYQQEGLGWFAFLQQFGFGGCLADDMGLGKCLKANTLTAINGLLIKAEDVWQRYAGEAIFDGEGYWADPASELLTNSIDERSGKIVQTRIQRLYRQRVQERLRTIELEDGSSVTITLPHKLLTDKGWTNKLRVGDYVCVPAKMIWTGKAEDTDLIKFLAWQISEGYEMKNIGTVKITQKDMSVLEELLRCLHRLSEKYNININRPAVRNHSNNRVADLTLNSTQYRRFLEARGYEWGKLSREKSIPPFIMQADLDSIRLFLKNYFDAEAAVIESMRSIEISTASSLLIQQLSNLLRRFGIWMRVSAKKKCATNGSRILRTYYIGTMGGNAARKFYKEIGFGSLKKQQRLEGICQQKNNTNVEGIPASAVIAETVAATKLPLRSFGLHSNLYTNGSQQFSRTSLGVVVTAFDNILCGDAMRQYQMLKPPKWTYQTLHAFAKLDSQQLSTTRKHLQNLLDREVYYCRIKAVEDVEYDGWVYDFEVAEHHNFVANNILCHNTVQVLALLESRRELHAARDTDVPRGHLNGELKTPLETLPNTPPNAVPNTKGSKANKRGKPVKADLANGDGTAAVAATVHQQPPRTSLVVMPRSLVFNWQQEAERFTPGLRVLDHTGGGRTKASAHFEDYDLVVTTYGTLRRDAVHFKDARFDYVILDEAQMIKNANTESAKAARLLQGTHRLALSGTPIENHLGELWSLFEFLNPGMLGAATVLQLGASASGGNNGGGGGGGANLDDETRMMLTKALRPFILRRTKEQVVKDLPQKLEQTIYCELEGAERKLYTELRDHYRQSLLSRVASEGLGKAKIQILEALLRLRQAACHRGLIDKSKTGESSAKLEMLLPRLAEALEGNHKVLVFSQFTSLLAIVRNRLDKDKITYEYLDGRTRDRAARVERFQSDPDCKLFLISLKAGGLGLNLTAAEYVFLLDPWWNPAVEAQAIDRAHRIGQTRQVFAYRLIARDTVEEKVLELQQSKRQLADAVINADNSLIRTLGREDLELLLS